MLKSSLNPTKLKLIVLVIIVFTFFNKKFIHFSSSHYRFSLFNNSLIVLVVTSFSILQAHNTGWLLLKFNLIKLSFLLQNHLIVNVVCFIKLDYKLNTCTFQTIFEPPDEFWTVFLFKTYLHSFFHSSRHIWVISIWTWPSGKIAI